MNTKPFFRAVSITAWRGIAVPMLLLSAEASAQIVGRNVELAVTGTALGGMTRLATERGARTKPYGGVRVDGGVQFATMFVGLGGPIWSAGAEHEFFIRAWRFVVSADLVVPPPPEPYGRTRPVLELGLGVRHRFVQSIRRM